MPPREEKRFINLNALRVMDKANIEKTVGMRVRKIDDPDAAILGRYCRNGHAAMTGKNGFASVYCAAQVMRSDLIASLAEWAGCHLFLHGDDVLYANENFVCVHAKDDGMRTVYFKRACSPFEVYEKRFYGRNVDHIDVDMYLGETKMWRLTGEC